MEKSIHWTHSLLTLALFLVTAYLGLLVIQAPGKKKEFLNPPPEHIELFSFGFADSLADGLWLRWIQDSEICQMYKGVGSSAAMIPDLNDDRYKSPRNKVCDNSWGFKMLDAVTKLAPRFAMPYLAGAMSLAVEIEDYDGATVIFNRGLEQYPKDWNLLFRAAYHFLFDAKDTARAADLLLRSSQNGGPYWAPMLAARLYTKSGQAQFGISALESYLKTVEDPDKRRAVEERLEILRKELTAPQ